MKSQKNAMSEPVEILVKTGKYKEAEDLLTAFDRAMEICSQNRSDDWVDSFLLLNNISGWKPSQEFQIWGSFARSNAHILKRGNEEWAAHKILLQLAIEHGDDSPLTIGAEKYLAEGRCDWVWLRRELRLKKWGITNPCMAVLNGHDGIVTDATVLEDGRIISIAKDGSACAWNQNGSLLSKCKISDPVLYVMSLTDNRFVLWSQYDIALWNPTDDSTIELGCVPQYDSFVCELPDGRLLILNDDDELHLFSKNGEDLEILEGDEGTLELPDGGELSWSVNGSDIEINPESTLNEIILDSENGGAGTLRLPDGSSLSWYSTADENDPLIWKNKNGKVLFEAIGHDTAVIGALCLSEDNRVVSWSADETLRIWEFSDRVLNVLPHHDSLDDPPELEIFPDGKIHSESQDGVSLYWDIDGNPIDAFEGEDDVLGDAATIYEPYILFNGMYWHVASDDSIYPYRSFRCYLEHSFPDGRIIGTCDDGQVFVLRTYQGNQLVSIDIAAGRK